MPIAIATGAVAVLALAFATKLVAPGPAAITPPPAAEAVTLAIPTVAPAPAPAAALPTRNPAATPFPTDESVEAAPGTTSLLPAGRTPVRFVAELPEGWARTSEGMLVKRNGRPPTGASISLWRLQHVFAFPCRWSGGEFADPPLMQTARGQAVALSSWWGQDPDMLPYWNSRLAPLATRPEETTLLGRPAWYLEVLIPSDLDLGECDGDQLVLWDTDGGPARVDLGPGELDRLWVVDVYGELIVIDAASFRATSREDLDELQAVVDSIALVP